VPGVQVGDRASLEATQVPPHCTSPTAQPPVVPLVPEVELLAEAVVVAPLVEVVVELEIPVEAVVEAVVPVAVPPVAVPPELVEDVPVVPPASGMPTSSELVQAT
jgi:hypothetical protein